MTTLHETAYPQLNVEPAARELAEIYTPTPDELDFVASIGSNDWGTSSA